MLKNSSRPELDLEWISRIHLSRLPSRSSTSSPLSSPLTCSAYSSNWSIVSAGRLSKLSDYVRLSAKGKCHPL